MSAERRDDLVYVGDVHLERDDPALDDFLAFLDRLGRTSSRIVFLGDLFNIWIGRREAEQSHHAAVVERLADLRRRGVSVGYVEGNRDYRIGNGYSGIAVDDASDRGIVDRVGGHRFLAVHGDLANPSDRQYRAWRRLSRSPVVWWTFNRLPRSTRIRLADTLENRFRATNLRYKAEFPAAVVRQYASRLLRQGHDVLVLGHFHVERDLQVEHEAGRGRAIVLPEWKGSRRHLEARSDGRVRIVDS